MAAANCCTLNRKFKTNIPEMKLGGLIPFLQFMYLWAIYMFPRSVRKRNTAK